MWWIIKQWAPLSFYALLSKVYVGVQSDSFMQGVEKNKRTSDREWTLNFNKDRELNH